MDSHQQHGAFDALIQDGLAMQVRMTKLPLPECRYPKRFVFVYSSLRMERPRNEYKHMEILTWNPHISNPVAILMQGLAHELDQLVHESCHEVLGGQLSGKKCFMYRIIKQLNLKIR